MISWQSRTNRNLFYAGQCLAKLDEESIGQSNGELQLSAFWLHLHEGFACWLNELAGFSKHQGAMFASLDGMLSSEFGQNPECQRLINLKEEPNSWLRQLVIRTDTPGQLADFISQLSTRKKSTERSAHAPKVMAIAVKNLDERDEPLVARETYTQMKRYIEEVRAQQTEW